MLAAASQAMKEIDLDSLNDARREMERLERSADEPVEEELLEPHGDIRTTSQNAEHLHQQFCCCVPSSLQCGIKAVVLVCVVLQNSSYALARRYSRGTLKEDYSANTALIMMELTKLFVSMFQIVTSNEPSDVPDGPACSKYVYLAQNSLTMLVPAALYLVINILGFLALGRIDAGTFTVLAQLKVLSTALFSVTVLGKHLTKRKWRALVMLVLGVVLITYESMPKKGDKDTEEHHAWHDYLIGVFMVCGEVLLSGFASIYFEKVLKSKQEVYSVWDRNFQLAGWSILIYTPLMIYDNPTNPFNNWTVMAGVCALLGSIGGLLVALTLKHADAIVKTLATTMAIVLITSVNAAFLDGPFTLPIVTGSLVVIVAVFNYNDDGDGDQTKT